MNIAAMRVRITFQKNAVTVDKYGNHKNSWTDYFSCWATVGTSTGSESTGVVINPDEFYLPLLLRALCRGIHEVPDHS